MENFQDEKKAEEKTRTKDIELTEKVTFDDMLLSKPILEGLKAAGFFKPSPIQLKACPLGKLGLGNSITESILRMFKLN
jgi:superfamily II DNA/RNA helicase